MTKSSRWFLWLGLFAVLLINVQTVFAQTPAAVGAPQFRTICVWDFAGGDSENVAQKSAFHAQHACRLSAEGKSLTVEGTGGDPYFGFRVASDARSQTGKYSLKIVLTEPSNLWELFWGTASRPGAYAEFSVRARADESDVCAQTFDWDESEPLVSLRLDPPDKQETWRIARIELRERVDNPVILTEKKSDNGRAIFVLKNLADVAQTAVVAISQTGTDAQQSTTETFAPGETKTLTAAGSGQTVEEFRISVGTANGFAPFTAEVRLINVQPKTDGWPELATSSGVWKIHPEGVLAVFTTKTADKTAGKPAAIIAPLVRNASGVLVGKRVAAQAETIAATNLVVLEYATPDGPLTLNLGVSGNQLTYRLAGIRKPTFGPTVFALGEMTNASFPGLEMLEKGERSSSTLDIETAESDRSRPNRDWVTQTSMLIRTDLARVSVRWPDAALQPEFAVPDFIDSTSAAGRMSLEAIEVQSADKSAGQTLDAQIVVDSLDFVEAIADDVRALYGDLPAVPASPRSDAAQMDFCLETFVNRMQDDNGWGHCIEKRWGHAYHGDHASCIWRASEGQIPFPGKPIVNGGGHVNNPSIFFAANQAQRYLDIISSQAASLCAQADKDLSFPYFGKYDRGHWEHTALGTCARPAFVLCQKAYLTADGQSCETAERILDYMKRFSVPRGGQVWEMPLHTPDPLAGAYAILAYVRGYQLTGNQEYLREARKWAITGIPFVYLRPVYRNNGKPSELANCLYATIGVYGATNWKAPLWIGRPVQWIGTVYAYALTVLAPYNQTFDWNKLARGILVSAEYQQYPDGEFAGTLPDSVEPNSEPRHPWNINPSALMMLQWKLSGVEDNVTAISNPKYRVAGPFAMIFADPDTVEFLTPNWMEGKPFQVFVNGQVRSAVGGKTLKLDGE